ncbi:hypothetical protein ZOSMA_438G00090 [Zostera marina]|uniref:Uncharacterized protein n=1 Tax=Zostera marina TaxID=29655 RepID=A0A0K9P1R9_ZOSMR|nr:hypothetical protein ZOSMA_438G00090 [Zostera marina]
MIQTRIQHPKQLVITINQEEAGIERQLFFPISLSFFLSYSKFCSFNFWKRTVLCQSNLLQQSIDRFFF